MSTELALDRLEIDFEENNLTASLTLDFDELFDEQGEYREQVADLEADVQELRAAFESTAEHVEQLASTFDVDVEVATATFSGNGEELDEDLQEHLNELEAENTRLRRQLSQQDHEIELLDDYADFLEDEDVQEVIQEAKD